MNTRKASVSAMVSGVIAFLSSLLTAVQGGSVGWSTITPGQWLTAVLAFVVAFAGTGGLTYAVPNTVPVAPREPATADR